ncbi:flagellar hook-length control protein FliK [Mixta theicola]|uniref:Flagellar hook-length control protein FliK n=1 Tax=Mixta theicola TaxID=1458355 RepID=A0A2K1Q6F7_9GAMM|nr:flagellar hook-length control protein FliK [Mixta theicola]PNS10620.1 flagellar hook-length control protein FliK [Mixta theicola]GLR11002.1 flagellar hook-length control protein FliK [Mixta theicola]
MIKLPTSVNTVSVESGADLTSGDGAASGQLPDTFLSLLGNRLLTLAKQGDEKAAPVADAQETLTEKKPAAGLSQLLSALQKPDAINALLTPEKAKENLKLVDDKDELKQDSLSAADQQSLQALFAMLPQTPLVQQAAKSNEVKLDGESLSPLSTQSGNLKATLATLTAQQPAAADQADAGADKASLTGGMPLTTAATTAGSEEKSPLSSFQSLMNDTRQEEGKDNKESLPTHTLSALSAVMNNATAAAAAPTASATAMTPATSQINAQLGSPEWQQAVSQQVLMFSRNGQQNAELHLHPDDLGAIQISLKLDDDQAQLNMVSNHSQVRAALEAALPHLRTALAENGINLAQSNVSSDAFPQSQSFGNQQESRRDQPQGGFSLATGSEDDVTPLTVPAALQARAAGSSAVDTFA